MLGLFKQAKTAPSPSDTLKRLREVLDTLEKREAFLGNRVTAEREKAKRLATSNKKEAMMALKRKALYTTQIEKLNGARLKLDEQIIAIEAASTNLIVLDAMSEGAQTMKQINRQMTIEKVEEINDEIQDQMMVAEEIGSAIAQPSGSSLVDEDELEAELNALAQESLEDGLGTLDESALDLPSVPQKGLPAGVKAGAAKQPAADPFDSLQMEMNM